MRLRTLGLGLISILLATTLSACGSGQGAETRKTNQVTDGVEKTITANGSKIKILNFLVVATSDSAAVVVGTIINEGDIEDTLLGASVGSLTATLTGVSALKTNAPIRFEGEQANAKAVFLGANPQAGRRVLITLGFARAGLVTLNAIIRDQRDEYANIKSK